MAKIRFDKYQGTGNDFVIIDQTIHPYLSHSEKDKIQSICDRRFGIGADGLILVESDKDYDYRMVYFNADGSESTMCGNGGRCIAAFARKHEITTDSQATFVAIDGVHEAIVDLKESITQLKMKNVTDVIIEPNRYILDTGSPHYVTFVEDIDDIDVPVTGKAIRYSSRFAEKGINVNFVEDRGDYIIVATYERGVEDETYSCGTGVVASAMSYFLKNEDRFNHSQVTVPIQSKGGNLEVRFEYDKEQKLFHDVWLMGPATFVYSGVIEI